MAGITTLTDISQELKPSRVAPDNDDLNKLIRELGDTLNPFCIDDNNLYCLSTGKATSSDVKDSLLNLENTGAY